MSSPTIHSKTIFRENALNSQNTICELQQALKVVDAKSITSLIAALLALVGIVLWGVVGRISIEVPARGMMLSVQQIAIAEQRDRELKSDHEVALNAKRSLLAKKQMLYDKHYLTIDELERAKQEYFDAKVNLNNLTLMNHHAAGDLFVENDMQQATPMEALVFVSHEEGKKIAKGMHVYLLPSTLSTYEYGYINGRVKSVSSFPATKESVLSYLGNSSLVDEYFSAGAPFVVKISIEEERKSASGLSWTTSTGAPFRIEPGSLVSARIINRDYHPYQFLMKQYLQG